MCPLSTATRPCRDNFEYSGVHSFIAFALSTSVKDVTTQQIESDMRLADKNVTYEITKLSEEAVTNFHTPVL